MKEAVFYSREEENLRCHLCPHLCLIRDGHAGICRVRRNEQGTLMADNYGRIASIHLDPVEKKPLYHYHPGAMILSIGTVGCNLQCRFCQNHQISQSGTDKLPLLSVMTPETLVNEAATIDGNIGIAYTYNEPVIWFEYVLDTARLAQARGLKNVMVTNGFVNSPALKELIPFIDAFNVDLKAFSESFYRTQTFSRLAPVLESLRCIKDAGKHLEITYLVIPGLNDDPSAFEEMLRWIQQNMGDQIPLHLSRFFPAYRMNCAPTPMHTLRRLYEMASLQMPFVYLGNVSYQETGRDTQCPSCGQLAIKRLGYDVDLQGLDEEGACSLCGYKISIR